ncbi:MAG: hypothetical protein DI533_00510 [Cereibacter sphaeroides]|uniref:Uncharacterized protein n=1 Tax=Cereibacter sphaeroides TaxID=1063 RepID=A0A2W5SHH6_CERSP|nr:MAG: hypothetical protein DI533_00510 [Cereibacter sphaeroides]
MTGCGLQYETASSYNGPPALQLHDDAGGAVQSTIRSLSGDLFDLTGASIFAWVNTYLAGDWVDAPTEEILRGELPGYENVGLFGYRDGALVASLSYFQPSGTTGDANIGDGFKGLDTLVFKLLQPNPTKVGQLLDFGEGLFFQGAEGLPKNEVWCDAYYCGALYGQITLEVSEPSPVPLPATLPLLLTGLLLLRRRL